MEYHYHFVGAFADLKEVLRIFCQSNCEKNPNYESLTKNGFVGKHEQ